jgi:hypothetical protein
LAFWLKRAGEAVEVTREVLEHAEWHERFWTNIRDDQQDSIEGYRRLIACAERNMVVAFVVV